MGTQLRGHVAPRSSGWRSIFVRNNSHFVWRRGYIHTEPPHLRNLGEIPMPSQTILPCITCLDCVRAGSTPANVYSRNVPISKATWILVGPAVHISKTNLRATYLLLVFFCASSSRKVRRGLRKPPAHPTIRPAVAWMTCVNRVGLRADDVYYTVGTVRGGTCIVWGSAHLKEVGHLAPRLVSTRSRYKKSRWRISNPNYSK